ncbi:membrane protein [Salmonella enterica subsp. enterica]|uniref:Membrane protein n=1 Tax=Salmonella enterica I TaxID=59201 RepID=A0A447TNN9_SALET|nr:membrane protein [Salmonella enterica subsp. enterica]
MIFRRLSRRIIDIVAPGCLVISEEFSDWEDSRRRIDLLAIDKQANLVVIELKRDEIGAHMELQALRYAAMISTMSFCESMRILSGISLEAWDR